MASSVDMAREIIRANRYMTLGTRSEEAVWVSPVAYVVDTNYHFYWYSATNARHSDVAVAIFNSTEPSDIVNGVQMPGIASLVAETDLQGVMDFYWQQSFPDESVRARWILPIGDFTGDAILRFYQFIPNQVFILDPDSPLVDRRLEVSLEELRRQSAHS
jgi:uncharacterized protein YhbP (UPF0306 family)